MASSTPPGTDTPSASAPRHETLDTIAAQIAAIDELIGLARRSIRVFDIDLSEMRWNDPARIDRLAAFLRGSRHARLDIIVHDTRYIEGRCARLTALQRLFGEAVTIRRTGPGARGAMDPLVIVDGQHYLHRFHVEQPRALLGILEPHPAKSLIHRFDEIWAGGEPGVSGAVLGL
jgi:hypothetical protein